MGDARKKALKLASTTVEWLPLDERYNIEHDDGTRVVLTQEEMRMLCDWSQGFYPYV